MTQIIRGMGQMARGLTIAAIVIAVLMLILFVLDMVPGVKLLGGNMIIDIAFLVCGVGLILLGISTWRELE